jgi:hypothetical protein
MEFRLTYRGPLKSKKSMSREDTHKLRCHFHEQLVILWGTKALDGAREYLDPARKKDNINLIQNVGAFQFAPLVSQAAGWNTVAELQILFLRPSDPGQLIGHEGDLDNRLKSLFDGLRMPSGVSELPDNAQPGPNETPFFCLLQDDALVTGFSVVTDRLLIPVGRNEVDLTIHARVMATKKSMGNDVVW